METKTCTGCKQNKILSDFAIEKGKVISRCRICVNAQKAAYKRRKREEAYQERIASGEVVLPINPIDNFICPYCHIEQSKTMFRPNRDKCLNCERAYGREYRQSDIGKEKSAQWLNDNRERMSELQAEWYQRNKEKRNEDYNRRYHSDVTFKFKVLCKSRIQTAFKTKDMRKSDKTVQYLNCSIPWLIEWFTTCFTAEMTVENHGDYWHMDHVIPINTFDLTDPEQIKLCFSWYNLSPLSASENMAKHDSINVQQIQQHVQKLLQFETYYNIHKYIDLCARHLRMTGNPLEFYLPLQ